MFTTFAATVQMPGKAPRQEFIYAESESEALEQIAANFPDEITVHALVPATA